MTAIPLRCYICPQEPDFSDLSHLLTHVSSKGHLSHHLKAQLRGRVDNEVREKLDAYDQWYEHHQIETLLSQRLSAKASRNGHENEGQPSTRPTKAARTRKSRIKNPTLQLLASTPVKAEAAIDPRLSRPQTPSQRASNFQFTQSGLEISENRMHVPHMSEFQYWQAQSQFEPQETGHTGDQGNNNHPIAGSHQHNEANSVVDEDDYFRDFVRSPTRSASHLESPELLPSIPVNQKIPSIEMLESSRLPTGSTLVEDEGREQIQCHLDSNNSPLLKGIKWPGMSIFDSACADAQRLRNQKKDRSILEQMAQNSSVVEQMEHIYWPDGTLKKSRFITGNVDSSPSSQPSPVLKPPRRKFSIEKQSGLDDSPLTSSLSFSGARVMKPRTILAEVDTNALISTKKSDRKSKARRLSVDSKSRKKVCHSKPNRPITTPKAVKSAKQKDSFLPSDSPSIGLPRQNPNVVQDSTDCKTLISPDRLPQTRNHYKGDLQLGITRYKTTLPIERGSAAAIDYYSKLHSYPKTPDPSQAPEQAPAEPELRVRGVPTSEGTGRVTQMYFSVDGNEEPQFFTVMPPQMEFGGIGGPKYRGATLNPLNPHLRQSHFRPPHM